MRRTLRQQREQGNNHHRAAGTYQECDGVGSPRHRTGALRHHKCDEWRADAAQHCLRRMSRRMVRGRASARTTTEETMASTRSAALSAAALGLLIAASAHAQTSGPGVTDKEIKIGQTMPYSGPVSAWSVQGGSPRASTPPP